jgi:alpha-tubulin suppressor-like RCC1 family protein
VPGLIAIDGGLTMVTTGDTHGCGLTPGGAAYCWGDGTWGQLGNAGTGQSGPQQVATSTRFITLAAGAQHTCGLASDGQLYCWGLGDHGQLGLNPGANCFIYDYDENTPVLCALTPQRVTNAPKFVAISAGYGTCGLTADHEVFCFGFPGGPVSVSSGIPFTRLTPDGNCGETVDDHAYCWARASDSAYSALLNVPLEIGIGLRFSTLSSSRGHQCGIERSAGSVVCWGRNDKGQLGNRTRAPSTTPLPVARPEAP